VRLLRPLLDKFKAKQTLNAGEEIAPAAIPSNKIEADKTPTDKTRACETSTADAATIDITSFDPFDQCFIEDPYPNLRFLQAQHPIFQSKSGNWVMTRHQDIANALADTRFSNTPSPFAVVSQRNSDKFTCANVANNTLPFLDAPEHTAPRKLITRAFHEQMKSASFESVIDANAIFSKTINQATNEAANKNSADLLTQLCTPLCTEFMCEIFGIEGEQAHSQLHTDLKNWSDWFFYLFSIIPSREVRDQLNQELGDFRVFFQTLIENKKAQPGSDLISKLLTANESNPALTEQVMIDNCMLLMADGINADYGVANALLTLIQQPEKLEQLRQNPELIPDAVHELLRFESPSLFIARRALEDIQLGEQLIKKNSGVLLMLAAANRDPELFEQADELQFDRKRNLNMSFGKGEHTCIGRVLVTTMCESAIKALIALPAVTVDDAKIQWELRAGHRWLKGLPVVKVNCVARENRLGGF